MAKKSFDGNVLHFGSLRLTVTGSGQLNLSLKSLKDAAEYETVGIPMQSVTDIEPVVLANFRKQRACVEGFIENIDDSFEISKIIIYVVPVATGYPQ